ncbi:MAG: twin-arginine translocation pathway signal protein, partial [Parvularculaceae bacterium]
LDDAERSIIRVSDDRLRSGFVPIRTVAEKGLRAEIIPFPEGEPAPTLDARPIAHVRLVADASVARDPLFGYALTRRTNRNAFEAREVAPEILDVLKAATVPGVFADAAVDPVRLAEIKELAKQAWRTEWTLDRTRRESIKVTRLGKKEIDEQPFGLALAGPLLEGLSVAGLLTREKMDTPGASAYEQAVSAYVDAIEASPAFLFATTATSSRRDQLDAGAAFVRMHLAATKEGLACQPVSQALQEFPEMGDHYRRAHALLASGGGIVQMLARVGYAKGVPPAPREALEAQLIS